MEMESLNSECPNMILCSSTSPGKRNRPWHCLHRYSRFKIFFLLTCVATMPKSWGMLRGLRTISVTLRFNTSVVRLVHVKGCHEYDSKVRQMMLDLRKLDAVPERHFYVRNQQVKSPRMKREVVKGTLGSCKRDNLLPS